MSLRFKVQLHHHFLYNSTRLVYYVVSFSVVLVALWLVSWLDGYLLEPKPVINRHSCYTNSTFESSSMHKKTAF